MIFEKLRKKLIRKLGGYVIDPERGPDYVKVTTRQKAYVTLEAQYMKSHPDIWNTKEIQDWVEKELAYKLANEMLDMGLIRFIEFPVTGARGEGLIPCRILASITVEDNRFDIPKIPQEGNSENE
jgi:hypothetical protein